MTNTRDIWFKEGYNQAKKEIINLIDERIKKIKDAQNNLIKFANNYSELSFAMHERIKELNCLKKELEK